jgi:hypothetical protein
MNEYRLEDGYWWENLKKLRRGVGRIFRVLRTDN